MNTSILYLDFILLLRFKDAIEDHGGMVGKWEVTPFFRPLSGLAVIPSRLTVNHPETRPLPSQASQFGSPPTSRYAANESGARTGMLLHGEIQPKIGGG